MAGLVRVRSGVAVGRVVTASHLAALQADAQMQPEIACDKTVFTAIYSRRQLCDPYMTKMRAGGHVNERD
jgi:hypothetical protein